MINCVVVHRVAWATHAGTSIRLSKHMAHEVDQKPDPRSDAQIRALWVLASYLARKYRNRSSSKKSRNPIPDAGGWIRRKAEETYLELEEEGKTLDWIPVKSPSQDAYTIPNFLHASTNDTDLRSLFNLYRDATLKFIVEHNANIDSDMLPFLRALEPAQGHYFNTKKLQDKYGLGREYFFDRTFIENTLNARANLVGGGIRAKDLVERMLESCAGVWLVYRISTPPADIEKPTFETCEINVSLLRIRPFRFLPETDKLLPRFIYEFRIGDIHKRHRAEGYIYPMSRKLNFLGRLVAEEDNSVVSFNWPEDDGWAQGEAHQNISEKQGLAYSTNALGDRIAFYFLAHRIDIAVNGQSDRYNAIVSVLQHTIAKYPAADLQSSMDAAIVEGKNNSKLAQAFDDLGIHVDIPDAAQLEKLFVSSRQHVVFREP